MKVLVVGSGGREHALSWHLQRDGHAVLVAPGNGGTPNAVAVDAVDITALTELARRERVDLTIVGPEVPLMLGLVDAFAQKGLVAFGPTRAAAQLEWSKAWSKAFFNRYAIPTAQAEVVGSEAEARRAVTRMGLPAVLKADGLAAGKGVFVARTQVELEDAIEQLFRRRALGSAADQVLVEECLEGPELSVLAFTDGEHLAVMPPARDYKRLLDDDRGPNTGGMGGYTRPAYATSELLEEVDQRILQPTLAGMRAEGTPYRGVLYAGLMLTPNGPKVLEFNCRFGDPECQLILPLLQTSLFEVCSAAAGGHLRPDDVRWTDGQMYGVVLAAPGYPEAPQLGGAIRGLDDLAEDVNVFHAGTRREPDGSVVIVGGRVLTIVGSELDTVYKAAERIDFRGKQLRRDIGVEMAVATA
jgi:phosphoribosylamine--glycine ligase